MREKMFQSEHSLKALIAELEFKNSSLVTEMKRIEFELKEANLNVTLVVTLVTSL